MYSDFFHQQVLVYCFKPHATLQALGAIATEVQVPCFFDDMVEKSFFCRANSPLANLSRKRERSNIVSSCFRKISARLSPSGKFYNWSPLMRISNVQKTKKGFALALRPVWKSKDPSEQRLDITVETRAWSLVFDALWRKTHAKLDKGTVVSVLVSKKRKKRRGKVIAAQIN